MYDPVKLYFKKSETGLFNNKETDRSVTRENMSVSEIYVTTKFWHFGIHSA